MSFSLIHQDPANDLELFLTMMNGTIFGTIVKSKIISRFPSLKRLDPMIETAVNKPHLAKETSPGNLKSLSTYRGSPPSKPAVR
jgi:hypothetical protein